MKKVVITILLICVCGLGLWFIAKQTHNSSVAGSYIVTVGPELVDCVGEGPMKCMVVDGQLFYDQINGFDYEEGYTYTLRIVKEDKTDSSGALPAGTTSYSYTLIEEIEKEPFV